MQWQEVTAIYVIGNRFPVATFVHENQATDWADKAFPGEWIKKVVKIPQLPLAPKSAKKNLKNVAAMLDNLDWTTDDEDDLEPDQYVEPTPIDGHEHS